MKKLVMLILLVVLCVASIVFASYDAPPQPKASPDLAEFIIQTPADVYKKHGYSERTDIMYNLARFKELYIESTKQIQMLVGKVKVLEDRVSELEKPPTPIPIANDVLSESVPVDVNGITE